MTSPAEAGPPCPRCGLAKLAIRSFVEFPAAWCFGCGAQVADIGPMLEHEVRCGVALRAHEMSRPKTVRIPR